MHSHNGVWVADGDYDWIGKYYLFNVNVYVASAQAIVSNTTTDPYSIDLALNGTMSRITDLNDESTKPDDWDEAPRRLSTALTTSASTNSTSATSASADPTVPAAHQGHLRRLRRPTLQRHAPSSRPGAVRPQSRAHPAHLPLRQHQRRQIHLADHRQSRPPIRPMARPAAGRRCRHAKQRRLQLGL